MCHGDAGIELCFEVMVSLSASDTGVTVGCLASLWGL